MEGFSYGRYPYDTNMRHTCVPVGRDTVRQFSGLIK